MTITETLIAEHRVFLALFDQVERVLPGLTTPADVAAMAGIVEGLLRSHAEAEANLAYLALDHLLAHHGELQHLHQEHQEIDSRLQQVRTAKTCAEARRLLAGALAASRAHFASEERGVFPLLEQSLQPETLQALGKARLKQQPEPAVTVEP